MFVKIDRPFFGGLILNSDYLVEIVPTRKKYNDKEYDVLVLTMADGQKHDAFDKLPNLLKRLKAGGSDA